MLDFEGPMASLVIVINKLGTFDALKTSKMFIEALAVLLEYGETPSAGAGPRILESDCRWYIESITT